MANTTQFPDHMMECFRDPACTKYKSTNIAKYVENKKDLLIKKFYSLVSNHTKFEKNLFTALNYILLDYKTEKKRTEFDYDNFKQLMDLSLQLPELNTFIDVASEYDPTNEYNRTVIDSKISKDYKVLCLHKKRLHNITANERNENNVTGLMCKGGVYPVKIDKTKRVCRQLGAVFSKKVKKLTRNYVYDKITGKQKLKISQMKCSLQKLWNSKKGSRMVQN